MKECEAKGLMGMMCKNNSEVCMWASHIQYEVEAGLPSLVHRDLTGCADLQETNHLLTQRLQALIDRKGTISVAPLPQTTTL